MKHNLLFLTVLFCIVFSTAYSQTITSDIDPEKKYYVGSSLWVAYGLFLDPSPEFYQLNAGYRIDEKNTVSVEAITWKYLNPLGIPYGPDYETVETRYPGAVQGIGAGLSYQRFLWKGLYGQVHSVAFRQNYLNDRDKKIQSGFQLFNTFRVGYHLEFFNHRLFIEPSIAATWFPIQTNFPESFQIEEDRWNKFFFGEPGLHFGINF